MCWFMAWVLVHGMGVAPWHDKSCSLVRFRANRTEDMDRLCAAGMRR